SADSVTSLTKQIKDLDDQRNKLLDDIKAIEDKTKTDIEALQKQEADDLAALAPDLSKAFTDAQGALIDELKDLLGPDSDIHAFLYDAGQARQILNNVINQTLTDILKQIGGVIPALATNKAG